MSETDYDSYTIAELARGFERVEKSVTGLADEVRMREASFMPRGEFEAWRIANDRELAGMRKEISAQKPARASGWQIASTLVGALVGAGSLLGVLIVLVQVINRLP